MKDFRCQQSRILASDCDRIRDESGPAGRQSDEADQPLTRSDWR